MFACGCESVCGSSYEERGRMCACGCADDFVAPLQAGEDPCVYVGPFAVPPRGRERKHVYICECVGAFVALPRARGMYTFVACFTRMAIDHASLERGRKTHV